MFKNYVKIAWRNLVKNKMYSAINLTGLTIGMTCFILIALFIQFETSFDKNHEKADWIYRIAQQQKGNEYRGTDLFALAPLPLSEALMADFPEVESVTNLNLGGGLLVKNNKSFAERGLYTDENVFDVFTIPLIQGIGKEALEDPNSIILTESLAKKIFGDTPPIGQSILFGNETPLTVSGIVMDPPKNQHFNYSYIVSYKITDYYPNDVGSWASNNYHAYLTLAEGFDYKELEQKMISYKKFTVPAYKQYNLNFFPTFLLQPIKDIYLHSKMNMEIGVNSDIRYIYFFSFIALIILFLASINYMNLATAKSAQRAKEVGVSKVLGASKKHMVVQFLGESFILTLFSLLLAIMLAKLLLPSFNGLLNKEIPFAIVGNWWAFVGMLFIALIIGVLSGLYPALFLSAVNPIKALKGNFLKSHKEGAFLRNSLVVGQFVVAMVLAIGSIVIYQQLEFVQNKNLGYTKEEVVHVPYFEKEIAEKEDLIRSQLLSHPRINKVSFSTQLPMNVTSQGIVRDWEGNADNQEIFIYRTYVDYDFLDLFEMELIEGRGFSKEFYTDSTEAYVLNEAAVKKMGWTSAAGKKFHDGKVIGVVKDFHLQTFDLAIEPQYMTMRNIPQLRNFGQVILKIDTNNYKNTKEFIEKTMKAIVPLAPYEARFMVDSYSQMYDSETRLGRAFSVFTFLALFIAGMGLFGLVSFHVLKRTKEIGIRKVLGSSVFGIVNLLAKDFLKLVVIALVIATPIAYYFMNNWLMDYAYRIDIQWWVFVLVGMGISLVAFTTISFQSVKAARSNPVKSLRTE
ncbi:putative ABC transport system permease protein [Saonia flava]|uniref:Putative ABC transport system permease protein n=1 Tax=Saonia flava TaxID=523696 RepID=A0A846R037_9FLAO|nr:ABC transporter permease [Saonia flava]NJB70229.1 putative ABC transport system permease protein [Saonia flava]